MDVREKNLIDTMEHDPGDEDAKIRYEEYLDENRPDSVERQLLRFERELAGLHTDQTACDLLVDKYIDFKTENSNYFWDQRGCLDYLFRSFSLWLLSFNEYRRFAVEQSLRLTVDASVDLDNLPGIILDSSGPDKAKIIKDKIIDILQRYRGPTGCESAVQEGEIVMAVTPSEIKPRHGQ